jgi:hypothetical protein
MNGTGGLQSPYDIRDYRYTGSGTLREFDIEQSLGTKLVTKDQNGSSSCGGQAWAYYGEVLEKIATGDYEPRSAKWIYSQTHKPNGGSYGRDNCKLVSSRGWAREKLVPSYDKGKPPKEAFITQPVTVTNEIQEDIEVSKALPYLNVKTNFADICDAIINNNGCIILLEGKDNGTWRTKFPKPPEGSYEWRHFVYAGKVKQIDGKWYIGIKNSWGDKTGDKGWQYLDSSYVPSFVECWTMQWDYKPSQAKALLIQTISRLQKMIAVLTKKPLSTR